MFRISWFIGKKKVFLKEKKYESGRVGKDFKNDWVWFEYSLEFVRIFGVCIVLLIWLSWSSRIGFFFFFCGLLCVVGSL